MEKYFYFIILSDLCDITNWKPSILFYRENELIHHFEISKII